MTQELPRDFKGIWIPREIWLHSELSYFEKSLWAEIDSLDRPKEGCTASNDYFCKFFNERIRTLQNGLAKLKRLNLIWYESFDGRHRILRSCLKTTHAKFYTPAMQNPAPQPCKILHPSSIGDFIEREIKGENKDEISSSSPPKDDTDLDKPTKEEEEEFFRRLKERGKNAPKIQSMKKWRKTVLKDIRENMNLQKSTEKLVEIHKDMAMKFDGVKINGDLVTALNDRVEFTCGSQCTTVFYSEPAEIWKHETKRWFNGNT